MNLRWPSRGGIALTVAAGLTVFGGEGKAAVFDPETFTLDNGMQVVVVTNRRAPVVSHHVWYRIGSADSPQGKSGLPHFLEHLMFKGTESLASGEFSRIVARNGGNENAFTGPDYTGYFQTIAKDRLELVMRMEADRMTNLVLDEEETLLERDVILEERSQRTDNDPGSRLSEQINAAQYLHHPYRLPIIGWRHEIESYSREDALDFYRTWYAPNNAILIVAGDIDAAELRPLAERYYGVIPAREIPERVRVQEPPQPAPRDVQLADPRVRQPSWVRSYLAPSFEHGASEHAYPLEVLAEILGGTSTSRLYRILGDRAETGDLGRGLLSWQRARSVDLPGLCQPTAGGRFGRSGGGGGCGVGASGRGADHRSRGRTRDQAIDRRGGLCARQLGYGGAQFRYRLGDGADGRRRRGLAGADWRGDRGRGECGGRLCSRSSADRSPDVSWPAVAVDNVASGGPSGDGAGRSRGQPIEGSCLSELWRRRCRSSWQRVAC